MERLNGVEVEWACRSTKREVGCGWCAGDNWSLESGEWVGLLVFSWDRDAVFFFLAWSPRHADWTGMFNAMAAAGALRLCVISERESWLRMQAMVGGTSTKHLDLDALTQNNGCETRRGSRSR